MKRLGIEGRLVIAFTMAGGITVSGLLVTSATFSGQLSADPMLAATLILFVIGTVLGWVHAVLLGCAARQEGCDRITIAKRIFVAGMWSLPALGFALLAALGMAISPIAVRVGGIGGIVAAAIPWLAAAGICAWALSVGIEAFRNAAARYPEARIGTVVLTLVLLVLLISFQLTRPEIWGTDYRVNAVGAVFLACGATLWLVAPVLFSTLHLFYRRAKA